jgi:hypothetical protein
MGRFFLSKLDVQLFELVWLALCGSHPFLHVGMAHHGATVAGGGRVELDVIGRKARADRRVHRVRSAHLFAEQIRAAIGGQTFPPDRNDPIDIGPRAGP